jgi:hypothetical protein
MFKNPDLVLKLAFLGVGALIIICLTTLIGFGHDGTLVDALMGISAVIFGANAWQVGKTIVKK